MTVNSFMIKLNNALIHIRKIPVWTWVRAIVFVITNINAILATKGYAPIPVNDEELYTTISVAIAVISGCIFGYFNESVTDAALEGDRVMHELMDAKKLAKKALKEQKKLSK